MPDISKCDVECPKHDSCLRYMKDAEQYQNYKVNFDKICNKQNNYTYYIEIIKTVTNTNATNNATNNTETKENSETTQNNNTK